jgi:hypothetical protein
MLDLLLPGSVQEETMKLSRRDFAKLCGASAVALGVGAGLRPERADAGVSPEIAASPLPKKLEADLLRRLEADGGTDPLVAKTVQIAENMEPVIPHPEQEAQVKAKLAELEAKTGKKPNILIYLMDDVGWGDPGCYGGGAMAGAPTPNMDRLAAEGLMLTSCYSQPTCSPSRATMLTGRLPMRHGILRPPMYGEAGGLQDEITLARLLSEAGYVTQGWASGTVARRTIAAPQCGLRRLLRLPHGVRQSTPNGGILFRARLRLQRGTDEVYAGDGLR